MAEGTTGDGGSADGTDDGTDGTDETGGNQGVDYRAIAANTDGSDWVYIVRQDWDEPSCTRLVIRAPHDSTDGVNLPMGWGVHTADVSLDPLNCEDPIADPNSDYLDWVNAIGIVDWSIDDAFVPCTIGVLDVRIDFDELEGWPSSVDMLTTGLPVEDCQP